MKVLLLFILYHYKLPLLKKKMVNSYLLLNEQNSREKSSLCQGYNRQEIQSFDFLLPLVAVSLL